MPGSKSPDLSAGEWQVVAEQLGDADGSTWRGVLWGVCRAARDRVECADSASKGGRRLDPRVLARKVTLLLWAAENVAALSALARL